MLPVAANVPLALCSVLIRRILDSHTGRLVSTHLPVFITFKIFLLVLNLIHSDSGAANYPIQLSCT